MSRESQFVIAELEKRVQSLEAENARLRNALEIEVKAMGLLREENTRLRAELAEARRDIRYLLTFVPLWAKTGNTDLRMTDYTDDDRGMMQRVQKIQAAIDAAMEGEGDS